METLAKRLKETREEQSLTQKELAEIAHLKNQSIIAGLESGHRKSSSHTPAIAAALGINALWLAEGKGQKRNSLALDLIKGHAQKLHETQMYQVPLVSWVQAGGWCEVEDYMASEWNMVDTTYRARERTFALVVDGPSMEPKFPNGCTIIIEPEEQPVNGSYVIVRQNGDQEATFKQLVIEGGKTYLKALNPDWPKRIMEMLPDAVVIGVVKKMEMEV